CLKFCYLSAFFFYIRATSTELYTLSLHDALPICPLAVVTPPAARPRHSRARPPDRLAGACDPAPVRPGRPPARAPAAPAAAPARDRKSTRLNSSHVSISYAVFCLKKKNHLIFFRT